MLLKPEKLLYRIRHGSHMYGTNTEGSDEDFKEVYIPSGESILLQRITKARASGPAKAASEKNKPGDIDTQSFSVGKLFQMLTMGDIIGCEMIFTPENCVLFKDPLYDRIIDNQHIFLSRKVEGYVGYCRQQANKYGIRGSRIAAVRGLIEILKQTPVGTGTRKLSELRPELETYVAMTDHTSIVPIENGGTGQVMDHLECCDRKAPFTITIMEAYRIYRRVLDEYGHRALAAEKNQGIDWKALSHAVRVGLQAIELLETKHITFPRPEKDDLLAIKKGKIEYKEVARILDRLLDKVLEASPKSKLPEKHDQKAVDKLLLSLHYEMVK